MSKSLIRLVDEAILPAFLIIGLKAIAIAGVNNILSLSYYYQNFGKIYYPKPFDALLVNTYSDFFVFFLFFLCIAVILIKLLYFSDNKTNPSIILKLAKANKMHFIQTSLEIYHILFVWMVFFTGIVVYILIRVIYFIDYPLIILPIAVIYMTVIWVIIKEVERDIIKRLEFGKQNLV